MDKDEIRRAAAAFAQALEGIEGKLPIERIARKEIQLFRRLRNAETPWSQIATMLSKAGVTRQDGRPISADQLRAMISRVERSLVASPDKVHRAVTMETHLDERSALHRAQEGKANRSSPSSKESTDQNTDYAAARRIMARASAARKP